MDILSEDGDLSEQNFADSYLFLPIHESHLNVGNTVWDALVSVPIVVAAVWATRILLKTSRKTDLVILTLGIQLLAL
jgi:hypothetical protein